MKKNVRVATRQSQLAQWQADHVISLLSATAPEYQFEKVLFTTQGDRILDRPLSEIGGKGLFLKELEIALQNNEADIAVHSLKDIPHQLSEEFVLGSIIERHNPLDAFVSVDFASLDDLPSGSIVGSSSLRRVYLLRKARPDLIFKNLRGNSRYAVCTY